MKPYALFSDQHCHNWSAYATRLPGGMNSRLKILVDELHRGCAELRKAGGTTALFAGDLFHSRGSIDPEVFNPVADAIDKEIKLGTHFVAIPGNHDLKSNETTELGNAIQSLGKRDGFHVVTKPETHAPSGQFVTMVPWIPKLDDLKETLEEIAAAGYVGDHDLVIHAGIDGVLSGVPAHGLTPAYLAGLGFRRVFAGHYHHHCTFEAGKVWSIGALAHKDFGDIGTKAGFCLVYPDRVVYRASRAPSFVEVTPDTSEEDIATIADGAYVRVRGFTFDDTQANAMRRELTELGAAGVLIQCERTTVSARSGTVSAKGVTLEASVDGFITRMGSSHEAAVRARAAQIISDVRATAE